MKLPYGLADFYGLIRGGYAYVDRTAYVRTLEELGRSLLFIRPRRFGKSLWLQTLRTYYDLRRAGEHQALFGDLAIGRDPTPLAHRYFVLVWNFSAIEARGSVDDIGRRLGEYVLGTLEDFLEEYRHEVPGPVKIEEDPVRTLGHVLTALRQTPCRLYLLIDEYDNFANEVMTADQETYQRLVHADGPFKQVMKWVKLAMEGQGLERLFVTGVSPVVMSDLTSGLNICKNVYLYPQLNDLCGFREEEVRELLTRVLAELAAAGVARPELTVDAALETMRTFYDGYRFATEAEERIYNPTLTLYFLSALQDLHAYPREMLDVNLAIDEDKLRYVARVAAGRQVVLDLVQTGGPIEVLHLEERFSLARMLEKTEQDETFLASFLYYFGMLTLERETARRRLLLTPPNLVVRKLYVDQVRRFLEPARQDRSRVDDAVGALTVDGRIEPLLAFVEEKLFPAFSQRDYRWVNELAVKTAFLTLLADEPNYMIFSEPELERRFADLCLLRRPDARSGELWDVLIEFKYLSLDKLKLRGDELRRLERGELLRLAGVEDALAAAEEQVRAYRTALVRRHGDPLRLRGFAVASLGFERLVARELAFRPDA